MEVTKLRTRQHDGEKDVKGGRVSEVLSGSRGSTPTLTLPSFASVLAIVTDNFSAG